MFWMIVGILFMLFVVISLSTIQYQLSQVLKHFNIKEPKQEKVSNEEIERELEEYNRS